ncbi:MAG: hypothetical protein ACC656_12255, partial [Candidatus Heimdallarchaeota archaeon]
NGLFGQEDNDNILIEMNKGIEIQKKLKHKFRLFSSLNNLSVLCGAMGVYEKVLEIGREQQDLAEKLNNKRGMSGAYSNFAWYYSLIGNYEKMEEFTSKKMELDKENNDRLGLSLCYYYIGMVAFLKGENDEALRAMSRSLEFAQDLNHSTAIASRLFNLILISLELNSETLVNSYMGMLQELDDTTNLLRVSTFTNLAQALIHKSKSRAKDKTEAQKLLTQIIYGNLHQSIPFNFTLLAMLHLSELLLDELRTYGNDEVLKEVDDLTRKIYEMAQERQLVYEIIHILILQSKLAFLGLELDKANKILQQAHLIAEERSLDNLLPTIESEEKKLEEEIGLALEISKLATPMRERLEKSKIVNYLIEMQNLINARNE